MRKLISLKPLPPPTRPPSSMELPSVRPLSSARLRVISAPQKSSQPSKLTLLQPNAPRVLDFDIETRLVGFHKGFRGKPDDSEPISIAVSWYGEKDVHSILLGDSEGIPAMIEWFREFFDQATMVTGHYIRKFDLPILQAACGEWNLPPLGPKLTHDTKLDLIDFEGISKSQENLGVMLRLAEGKYHMNDASWRRAARLTSGGQKRARKRAEKDVIQHKKLRVALQRRHLLRPPRVWDPRA